MTPRPSRIALIISLILMTGFPLAAIARHNHIQAQDIKFSVPISITPQVDTENFHIWSDINLLDLQELTGPDHFLRGQNVYVHMAMGPNSIAYPFAVTSTRPKTVGSQVFMIKGKVTGTEDQNLIVRYNFETFLPSHSVKSVVRENPGLPASARLAINERGQARLIGLKINGQDYAYRKAATPQTQH